MEEQLVSVGQMEHHQLLTVGDLSLGFSEDFRFDLGAIEKDSNNARVWREFGRSFL